MATILVLYASQEGQTEQIARYVGETLRDEGHRVAVQPVESPPPLAAFDAVMLGGSIHVGHYADTLTRYLKGHAGELNGLPGAFFSVCMTAARSGEAHRRNAQRYIDTLLADTGWRPSLTTSFAGALRFSEYGFFTRQVAASLAKQAHLVPDAGADYEFTDWDRVTVFTQDFSQCVEAALSDLPRPASAKG